MNIDPARLAPLRLPLLGIALLLTLAISVLGFATRRDAATTAALAAVPDVTRPVRDMPDTFPPDTSMPAARESATCGAVVPDLFSPGRDLVYVDDSRVWWESDNDNEDIDCDHSIHHSMELPLRRLIELVSVEGGTLKVQDTYRAAGIHSPKSLHREGRAIDLTCDELGLETLARLCWAAGFDWVYHEPGSKNGGAHVHCSVRNPRALAAD